MNNEEKEYENLLAKVAGNIKKARNQRGLTQEDMVEYGFNYRHYQRIESGTYSINLHTLFRVSKALKTRVSDLLDE